MLGARPERAQKSVLIDVEETMKHNWIYIPCTDLYPIKSIYIPLFHETMVMA